MQIRSLGNDCSNPPRFCDAVLGNDNRIYLVRKDEKKRSYVRILWEDVVYQVNKLKHKKVM